VETVDAVFEVLKVQIPSACETETKDPKKEEEKILDSQSSIQSTNEDWDWNYFLSLCATQVGKQGEELVTKKSITEKPGRLYLVRSGSCEVTFQADRSTIVCADQGALSTFGHIDFFSGHSFLEGAFANEDYTSITIIEPYFLNVYLQHYPEIVLRHVFKELATLLYTQILQIADLSDL